jgi:D-alanyl-lipoteichoic acid acyltransferase DltB (MBOAT superfamily)
MSFQSYAFLLGFLPAVLLAAAAARRAAPWLLKPVLIAASLAFHATWSASTLPVLVISLAGNRLASEALHATHTPRIRRRLLIGAIIGNLCLLVWFRYLADLLATLTPPLGLPPPGFNPIAPLGISFFTFTQIGYLLDTHAGQEPRRTLLDYCLFVAFFPVQIAGPILTAREVMPRIATLATSPPTWQDLAHGGGIFLIGLLKKTLLADPLAPVVAAGHADPASLDLFAAWRVALSYFLQLYFDFSGYSDMAVGIGRLFGLRYPWNFASPYQARSIIAYWQRWHISLTRFFMATVHAPLAMAVLRWRRGRGLAVDRAAQQRAEGFLAMHAGPLTATMVLAGLWHGASLTYLVFGLLHGAFLAINHAVRLYRPTPRRSALRDAAATGLTCLCVLVGSVVFRAESVPAAWTLLSAMAGGSGLPPAPLTVRDLADGLVLILLLLLVWTAPDTRTIIDGEASFSWRLSPCWAVASGVLVTVGLLSAGGSAEFLYARF